MKIAVVGAGAVGCWYGGLLALAGHEVHLHARSSAASLRQDGLTLEDAHGRRRPPIAGVHETTETIGGCDLVIVTIKSTVNRLLPGLVAPLMRSGTVLLTLQNGMGNVETLQGLVPEERLVAGLCFVCINRMPDGVVRSSLAGHVRLASCRGPAGPAAELCSGLLSKAGVDSRTENSLEGVLWKKLCWNIPFNGLSIAAGGVTTDLIVGSPALRDRARKLMGEVSAAARACGAPFDDDHIEWQFTATDRMGPYRPSSLIDYLEGRDVEIDGIWAEPLRRGVEAGVAMPELTRLLEDIRGRLRDRGSLGPGEAPR